MKTLSTLALLALLSTASWAGQCPQGTHNSDYGCLPNDQIRRPQWGDGIPGVYDQRRLREKQQEYQEPLAPPRYQYEQQQDLMRRQNPGYDMR